MNKFPTILRKYNCPSPRQNSIYLGIFWASWIQSPSSYPNDSSIIDQNFPGAHLACYPVGTVGTNQLGKAPHRDAIHLPQTSVQIKKVWSYTSISHTYS
jgi:hypothetical protein